MSIRQTNQKGGWGEGEEECRRRCFLTADELYAAFPYKPSYRNIQPLLSFCTTSYFLRKLPLFCPAWEGTFKNWC